MGSNKTRGGSSSGLEALRGGRTWCVVRHCGVELRWPAGWLQRRSVSTLCQPKIRLRRCCRGPRSSQVAPVSFHHDLLNSTSLKSHAVRLSPTVDFKRMTSARGSVLRRKPTSLSRLDQEEATSPRAPAPLCSRLTVPQYHLRTHTRRIA